MVFFTDETTSCPASLSPAARASPEALAAGLEPGALRSRGRLLSTENRQVKQKCSEPRQRYADTGPSLLPGDPSSLPIPSYLQIAFPSWGLLCGRRRRNESASGALQVWDSRSPIHRGHVLWRHTKDRHRLCGASEQEAAKQGGSFQAEV